MKPWLGFAAIGLAMFGGIGAAIAFGGPRRRTLAGIANRADAPRAIEAEIDDAEARAYKAGAQGELEFIGAGMTGIVFCDAADRAYKVARKPEASDVVAEEAAWFKQAAHVPGVKEHLPRGVRYDEKNHVLIRECVRPGPKRDRRVNERRLWELHEGIRKRMNAYGWSAPEYKPDSYVYTRRGPVLVDGGFGHRRGQALVQRVLDVLNGRRKLTAHQRMSDLAFDLRMERDRTIPASVANKLLRRLQERDPAVEL